MNAKKLTLTWTTGMSRSEWLAFRQPITHVKKFLVDLFQKANGLDDEIPVETFFKRSPECYRMLRLLFEKQEWKEYIFPCLGASEIAAVVGLNPYKAVIELYYEKVGLKEVFDIDNAAMFWGKTLEDTIADKWQFWEGSADSVFENSRKEKIVRKCRRLNAYVQNKDFPWLFVSLDRVINKYSGKDEGSLECKTISGYSANMWENGIPPMYVAQLQTQLFVCEFPHGEMAILQDGRTFEVYPFDKHDSICQRLQRESKAFFDLVKKGIEHFILYTFCPDEGLQQDHLTQIHNFSPEPDGSISYEAFLKENHRDQGFEITGGEVELHYAKAYNYFAEKEKVIETKKREASNKLRAFMKDASKVSFGPDGYVSWREDKAGTRRFLVKVKADSDFRPDPELLRSAPLKTEEIDLEF